MITPCGGLLFIYCSPEDKREHWLQALKIIVSDADNGKKTTANKGTIMTFRGHELC